MENTEKKECRTGGSHWAGRGAGISTPFASWVACKPTMRMGVPIGRTLVMAERRVPVKKEDRTFLPGLARNQKSRRATKLRSCLSVDAHVQRQLRHARLAHHRLASL